MIRFRYTALAAAALALAIPGGGVVARPVATTASSHDALVALFADWRAFVQPQVTRGVPD